MPDTPIPTLKPHIVEANKHVSSLLIASMKQIEAEINASLLKTTASSLATQRALHKSIEKIYRNLDRQMDRWAKAYTTGIIKDFQEIALDDLGGGRNLVRYDEKYVADVFSRIHPANERGISAVRTTQMLASDIAQLQSIAVEATRFGAVSGYTQKQVAKQMRSSWESLYSRGGLQSFNFIDRSGRKWDNSNYFSMLVRTTGGRVHRDTYLDTLTRNGKDLAQINNSGTSSCPACKAFDGVIVSISGAKKDFPSASQARSGGVFHPNCLCYYSYIDEDRDADEIKEQAGLPNPETDDPKEWREYGKRYQKSSASSTQRSPSYMTSPSKKQVEASQKRAQEAREEL